MSDHLPECRYYPQQSIVGDVGCICDRLRACEQRVREDDNRALWDQRQFNAGVQAARDAVAASGGHSDRCICDECYGTAAALAAIDALRDGPLTELSKKGWDHRG